MRWTKIEITRMPKQVIEIAKITPSKMKSGWGSVKAVSVVANQPKVRVTNKIMQISVIGNNLRSLTKVDGR